MNEAASSFLSNIEGILESPDNCELRGVHFDPSRYEFWIEYVQSFSTLGTKRLYRDYFRASDDGMVTRTLTMEVK